MPIEMAIPRSEDQFGPRDAVVGDAKGPRRRTRNRPSGLPHPDNGSRASAGAHALPTRDPDRPARRRPAISARPRCAHPTQGTYSPSGEDTSHGVPGHRPGRLVRCSSSPARRSSRSSSCTGPPTDRCRSAPGSATSSSSRRTCRQPSRRYRNVGYSRNPSNIPAGPDGPRTSWLTDPDGYRIELVQWPAGHPDGITTTDFP
jgi:hypothetical protein